VPPSSRRLAVASLRREGRSEAFRIVGFALSLSSMAAMSAPVWCGVAAKGRCSRCRRLPRGKARLGTPPSHRHTQRAAIGRLSDTFALAIEFEESPDTLPACGVRCLAAPWSIRDSPASHRLRYLLQRTARVDIPAWWRSWQRCTISSAARLLAGRRLTTAAALPASLRAASRCRHHICNVPLVAGEQRCLDAGVAKPC
jgi:hypothetical protein